MIDLQDLFPRADPQSPPLAIGTFALASVVKILVIFVMYLLVVAALTLLERKLAAWFQDRRGPNRVGPFGLLQPVADGLKNFMKEESSQVLAERWLFVLAPAIAFVPAMLTWAVIPLASSLPTPWGLIDMAVASLRWDTCSRWRSRRSACTASCWLVGRRTTSTRCWAAFAPVRRWSRMKSRWACRPSRSCCSPAMSPCRRSCSSRPTWAGTFSSLTVAWFTFLVAAFAETNRLPVRLA
jgi:NADH-quinone oxidoreductase subunit H